MKITLGVGVRVRGAHPSPGHNEDRNPCFLPLQHWTMALGVSLHFTCKTGINKTAFEVRLRREGEVKGDSTSVYLTFSPHLSATSDSLATSELLGFSVSTPSSFYLE